MLISQSNKPIVITMGDPSGIGAEVTLKALSNLKKVKSAIFLVIGDFDFLVGLNKKLYLNLRLNRLKDVDDIFCSSKVNVLDLNNIKDNLGSKYSCGKASLEYIDKFLDIFKKGYVSGLVTAPVSKESIGKLLPSFCGHTEYLAAKTKTKDCLMMFDGGPFRVALLTTHIPLKEISANITKKSILGKIELIIGYFKKFHKKANPLIGVAGLNPHAGEGGSIGREEKNIIEPCCNFLRSKGLKVSGPHSTEALFYDAFRGKYDILLCMYHDQALAALKMIARERLVNVTLGLPFIRTSPAHGTGFDIRDKFIANPESMENAIKLAVRMSKKYKNWL